MPDPRSTPASAFRTPQTAATALRLAAAAAVLFTLGCSGPASVADPAPQNLGMLAARPQDEPADATTEAQPPPDDAAQRSERQLELIAPILLGDEADGDDARRSAAAAELLAIGTPRAYSVLEQALRSGEAARMLAVIRAMDNAVEPVPSLISAAVQMLPTTPESVREPLWRMLARHEQRVVDDISDMAMDANAEPDARVPAIGALGALRTRAAADRLIQLLDPTRDEPEAITAAACEALTRLTRLPYGNEPETWRQWWVKARNQTREEWLIDQVQRLVRERGELEHELLEQRRRTARIEQRVVDTLKELFRALPNDIDQQLAPLPALLEDELAVVRQFAIERIRFISRDLEIPTPLKARLAARLGDDDPVIRRNTARLLHDLNYIGLNALLADRLASETSVDAAAAYIEILQARPTPAALRPLLGQLTQPALVEPACQAMWTAIDSAGLQAVDQPVRDAMRAQLTALAEARRSPAVLRLAALLCEDDALPSYEAMLSSADPAVRTAVAQAFRARGHVQPLLDNASDPAIYPVALNAMAAAEPTPATFEQVLDMTPPNEDLQQQWRAAMRRLGTRMQPEDFATVDDLLARHRPAAGNGAGSNGNGNAGGAPRFSGLRLELLAHAVSLPAEQMTVDVRRDLVMRLAALRLDLGQYDAAHQDLESLAGVDATDALTALKFRAAAYSGHYDRAAEIEGRPAQWVALLRTALQRNPELARRLHDEIETRFGDSLEGETRTAFEAIQQQMQVEDDPAPPDQSTAESPAPTNGAGGY